MAPDHPSSFFRTFAATLSKTFKLNNTGSAALNNIVAFTNSTFFTITSAPASHVAYGTYKVSVFLLLFSSTLDSGLEVSCLTS
jgi:hypothetical protein